MATSDQTNPQKPSSPDKLASFFEWLKERWQYYSEKEREELMPILLKKIAEESGVHFDNSWKHFSEQPTGD
jgi:hypothetical protein